MTTPTYSFFPTAGTIVTASLRAIRGIDSIQGATTQQMTDGIEAMNFLLTSWQNLGLELWCIKTSSPITLIASHNPYTIGSSGADITLNNPISITQAMIRDITASTDMPINIISREEYQSLSNKVNPGTPNTIYYDNAYDGSTNVGATAKANLYVWPPADALTVTQKNLILVYQRPFLDFNVSTDSVDMPQQWMHALKWNLAAELMPEYGNPFMDQDRINSKAEKALALAMGGDQERVSLRIRPDARLSYKSNYK